MELLWMKSREAFRDEVATIWEKGAVGQGIGKPTYQELLRLTNQHVAFVPTAILSHVPPLSKPHYIRKHVARVDQRQKKFFKKVPAK